MTPLTKVRTFVMILFGLIFFSSFVTAGISMYYLSALALDSFQTSAVFVGILTTSMVLLIHSVWGCHRSKDMRRPMIHSRGKLATILFFALSGLLLAAFISWTVSTRSTYLTIVGIQSAPFGYWDANPGKESEMLFNFASEFDAMWQAGDCSGKDCVYPDCQGDPVELTSLYCTDLSMQIQFRSWASHYTGTANLLRTCIQLVFTIMNNPEFPTPTWCQSRTFLMNHSRDINDLMFYFTLVQCVLILLSLPAVLLNMRMVAKLNIDQLGGLDWLLHRAQLDSTRWFHSDDDTASQPRVSVVSVAKDPHQPIPLAPTT